MQNIMRTVKGNKEKRYQGLKSLQFKLKMLNFF